MKKEIGYLGIIMLIKNTIQSSVITRKMTGFDSEISTETEIRTTEDMNFGSLMPLIQGLMWLPELILSRGWSHMMSQRNPEIGLGLILI